MTRPRRDAKRKARRSKAFYTAPEPKTPCPFQALERVRGERMNEGRG